METKPGWKTTEFWLTVVANLLTVATVAKGMMKPDVAAVTLAVLNGAYATLRSLVKQPDITTLSKSEVK